MERQQMVRKVPVTTMRMVQEERVEEVPVRVCRQVAVEETVRVPRVVEKRVPVTYTYRVPRTMVYRVPLDPCGNPIVTAPPTTAPESTFRSPPPAKAKNRTPTEAKPNGKSNSASAADEQPALNDDDKPGPIDEMEDDSASRVTPRPFKVGKVKHQRET
jgi:hypothetical protein